MAIENLLHQSMGCYREMLELYERIRKRVAAGAPASVLSSLLTDLQDQDKQARQYDAWMQAEAETHGIQMEQLPDFWEWKTLLVQIRDENGAMQRHLRGALAVAKDELEQLNANKQMLSGYRSKQDTSGQRLQNISA